MAQVAERATCSPLSVDRIEKCAPTVAIGIYLRVLYVLQMNDDIRRRNGKGFTRFKFEKTRESIPKE